MLAYQDIPDGANELIKTLAEQTSVVELLLIPFTLFGLGFVIYMCVLLVRAFRGAKAAEPDDTTENAMAKALAIVAGDVGTTMRQLIDRLEAMQSVQVEMVKVQATISTSQSSLSESIIETVGNFQKAILKEADNISKASTKGHDEITQAIETQAGTVTIMESRLTTLEGIMQEVSDQVKQIAERDQALADEVVRRLEQTIKTCMEDVKKSTQEMMVIKPESESIIETPDEKSE